MTGAGDKKKNLHAAEDDDYIEKLFEKFSSKDKKGNEFVSKANAYKAAQKCVEKFRDIHGAETTAYLKENFDAAWAEHDIHDKKKIDITEAY